MNPSKCGVVCARIGHLNSNRSTTLPILAILVFLLSVLGSMQAQTVVCGSKEYLAALPVPPPKGPNIKRQVQLINCSDQVILGAANAAHAAGQPPYPVFPQSGTWVMQPFPAVNNTNVLTIDIPTQWYGQFKSGGVAPNFWGRTGCRYDPVANRAQCETGGCGGQYDCSSADLSPPPATTLAEWTFYQESGGIFIDSPDISAVNGANLTIDIAPVGGDALDPNNPKDFHWLNWNYPLTVHGADLRENSKCLSANGAGGDFVVKRSDINTTQSIEPNYPLLGYVVVDSSGNPTMPAGNNTLACLSNCGRYKFPQEVGKPGCDPKTDANCYAWLTFCAGDPGVSYGQSCNVDADCPQNQASANLNVACFKKNGPNNPGQCEISAFYKGSASACNGVKDPQPSGPASTVACNNTYGSVNPLDGDDSTKYDWADQPPVGSCSNVVFAPTKQKAHCIGDDTLHAVLHGAYTWPNDPEVFTGDSSVYRIIFSPGGRGSAPITPAQKGLPTCSTLPANYQYASNRTNCSIAVEHQGVVLGIARVANGGSNKWQSNGHDWPCFVDQRGAGDNGIVCRWNPPPAGNCQAPATDDNVVASACGRIDSGTTLASASITPKSSGDPLFLQVAIPKVLNNAALPVSVSGCVPSQGVGSWTLVASKDVHTNQGMVAWYKGTSNTALACTVTVTLAQSNPAELKVYDVPKFNGTVETTTSDSGDFNGGPPFPSVSAGVGTTAGANDLLLGALLMVNQQPTPITYWTNWLTNGANALACLNNNTNCPIGDGTDFLPGHGAFSANSEVGHQQVGPGTHYFHRDAYNIGQFSWAGVGIYLGLNP